MSKCPKQLRFLLILAVAAGCDPAADGLSARLDSDDPGSPPPGRLDCQRGPVPDVDVEFACDCVTVWSCKDLSNVVLGNTSDERVRFEGLSGDTARFCTNDGSPLTTVWVKSGRNHSGDGPGYGERFDAPADTCSGDAGTPPIKTDAGAPAPPVPGTPDAGVDTPKTTPDGPILL